jgi:hypothetical protein
MLVLTDNSSISEGFSRESTVMANTRLNSISFSASGMTCPFSHFETDCRETFNSPASCSCVGSLLLRSAVSFSANSISVPPILVLPPPFLCAFVQASAVDWFMYKSYQIVC